MGRTADALVEAIMLDVFPGPGATVDFGLDSGDVQQRYESYYYPVREGEITANQLHEAATQQNRAGAALTELVRSAPSNPHKQVTITTVYDGMTFEV